VGFAAAFGGEGASVLPFAVGAIAQVKGVQVLQLIILALLTMILALWLLLPGGFRKRGLEEAWEARENRTADGPEEGTGRGILGRIKNFKRK
jgi:nitrate/nitrite transporter NarK